MSKRHSVLFTDTAPPDKLNARAAVTIAAGQLRCIPLDCFHEGWLAQLNVDQTGGTNVAFTVDLYDSELPYEAGEHPVATAPAVDSVAMYEIIVQQSVTSGGVLRFRGGYEFAFVQSDNPPTAGQASRRLFLVIKPTGAGDTTSWDIKVVTVSDVGGQ